MLSASRSALDEVFTATLSDFEPPEPVQVMEKVCDTVMTPLCLLPEVTEPDPKFDEHEVASEEVQENVTAVL